MDDTDFSLDLDAVLDDRPLAASTPRAPRRPMIMPDNSPLLRKALITDKDGSSLGDEDSIKRPIRRELPVGHPLAVAFTPLQLPLPSHMEKKHPSPTKEELAQLSSELQELGIRPRSPEIDELAYSYAASSEGEKSGLGEAEGAGKPEVKTPPARSLRCRIPGPAGSNRSAIRFGIHKVPCGADSSEVDELA